MTSVEMTSKVRIAVAMGALFAAFVVAGPVAGQFTPPLQISTSGSQFENLHMGRDAANNMGFTFTDGSNIYYSSTVFGGGIEANVTDNAFVNGQSRLAAGALGLTRIVFEQEGTLPGNVGNDILLIDNTGGPFSNAVNVTFSSVNEGHPEIVLSPNGDRNIVYHATPAGGPNEVYLSINFATPEFVAEGSNPVITATTDGALHVAYERGGELHARRYFGGVFESEQTISNLAGTSDSLLLTSDGLDHVHAVFVNGGAVQYSRNEGAGYSAPDELEAGPIDGEPGMASAGAGHVAVAYSVGGSVFLRERNGGAFGAAQTVTTGPNTESAQVVIDTHDYVHIGYVIDGAIWYQNNVPTPTADFTSNIVEGELLLEVEFESLATGIITDIDWDFGDGATSSVTNPTHVYESVGPKTVTMTVAGPGGIAVETKVNYINVLEPTNVIRMQDITAFQGENDIVHPVLATHVVGIQGYQLAVAFDDTITDVDDATLSNTAANALDPEFVLINIDYNGPDSSILMAIIIDFTEPFDGRVIDPGTDQIFANIEYDIPASIPLGTVATFDFQNGEIGMPPINNIFTLEGAVSVLPFLDDGTVTIDATTGVVFQRGNANALFGIDLADGIFILMHLFSGGPAPPCPDAADFDDDGTLGLADGIGLLTFLFSGGPGPAYPFPGFGLDPTPDSLGPCNP